MQFLDKYDRMQKLNTSQSKGVVFLVGMTQKSLEIHHHFHSRN